MFLCDDESPPLLLIPSSTPSPLPAPPCPPPFSCRELAGGEASVRDRSVLSPTELEGDEEVSLEEEGGVSRGEVPVFSAEAGPAEGLNRCSGSSVVRVELQASSSTRRRSSKQKSRVTSSPTPSISAIAHSHAQSGKHRYPAQSGRSLSEMSIICDLYSRYLMPMNVLLYSLAQQHAYMSYQNSRH